MRTTLVVALLLTASPALALTWVLKLEGVPPEFTVGVDGAQLNTLSYGARATSGAKAALGAFVFTKPFAATSLVLLRAMAEKKTFATVTLQGRDNAGVVIEQFVLSGVQVASFSSAAGRATGLIDTISLRADRVVFTAFQTSVDWDQTTGRIE